MYEFIRRSMLPPPERRRCLVCDAKFDGVEARYGEPMVSFECGGYVDDRIGVSVCPHVDQCQLCEQERRHQEEYERYRGTWRAKLRRWSRWPWFSKKRVIRRSKHDDMPKQRPFYHQTNWVYSAYNMQVCDEHMAHRVFGHYMDRTCGEHYRATTELGHALGIARGWRREDWQLRPDSRHQMKILPLNPWVVYEHDLSAVLHGEFRALTSRSVVRPKPLFRFDECSMHDLAKMAADGEECAKLAYQWMVVATQLVADQYSFTPCVAEVDGQGGPESLGEAHTEVFEKYPAAHRVSVRDGWQWVSNGVVVAACEPSGGRFPIRWGKDPGKPNWWTVGGWSGDTVYIIGGGESLRGFDWGFLKGKRVIAVNRAYEKVPDADIVIFTDVEFASVHKDGLERHRGWKVWANPAQDWTRQSPGVVPQLSKMIAVRCPDEDYWGTGLERLGFGKNTGFIAMNLADVLGAGQIRLLGFDLQGKWWHDGYGDLSPDESVHEEHKKYFEWAAENVDGLKSRVVNVSTNSALDCFPSVARISVESEKPRLDEEMFRGRRVFVVGGGPSLRGFDWDLLEGESVIAVNRAYENVPDADILFSVDDRFYGWHCHKLWKCNGIRVWGNIHGREAPPEVQSVGCGGGEHAFGNTLETLGHGGNSGYAAVNLAYVLGAETVYLLGFDMHSRGGKQQWWHDGYPKVNDDDVYARYRLAFQWLSDYFDRVIDRPFRIINLNRESAIRGFPFGDFPDQVMPTFTSGFTPRYMDLASQLIVDLDNLGLQHHVAPWPDTGSWVGNCAQKPGHMQLMREMLEGPIVWVDSDARIRSLPRWFCGCEADVAIHRKPEVLSGTIWFGDTDVAREVIAKWVEMQESHPDVWDQKMLARALDMVPHREAQIPVSHVKIYDSGDAVTPVIEHFQASRERKVAGAMGKKR